MPGHHAAAAVLPALREFERITVTRIQVAEGEGVVGDPVRPVTYWYEDTGRLIAREDPHAEIPEGTIRRSD